MTSTSAMTTEACLAVATMMPIFLVGLIAENIAFKVRSKARWDRALQLVQVFCRAVIDLCTAVLIAWAMVLALIGLNANGLVGNEAQSEWTLLMAVVVVVLARWVGRSAGFRYPLGALVDFLLNAIFVALIRIAIARTARRLKPGPEMQHVSDKRDVNDPIDRLAVAYQLSKGLFAEIEKLVNTRWIPKGRAAVSTIPGQLTLTSASDPTSRLAILWSTTLTHLNRISDPGQRALSAARDSASLVKLLELWVVDPTSLTDDVIQRHVRRRLFRSFVKSVKKQFRTIILPGA